MGNIGDWFVLLLCIVSLCCLSVVVHLGSFLDLLYCQLFVFLDSLVDNHRFHWFCWRFSCCFVGIVFVLELFCMWGCVVWWLLVGECCCCWSYFW